MIKMPAFATPVLPRHSLLELALNVRPELIECATEGGDGGATFYFPPDGQPDAAAQAVRQSVIDILKAQTTLSLALIFRSMSAVLGKPQLPGVRISRLPRFISGSFLFSILFRPTPTGQTPFLALLLRSVTSLGKALISMFDVRRAVPGSVHFHKLRVFLISGVVSPCSFARTSAAFFVWCFVHLLSPNTTARHHNTAVA